MLGRNMQSIGAMGDNHCKRSPRPIDVFSLGRLTLFGMVRLCARQGVPGELISEGVATA